MEVPCPITFEQLTQALAPIETSLAALLGNMSKLEEKLLSLESKIQRVEQMLVAVEEDMEANRVFALAGIALARR
jgi:cob(I)alamin adenosyltransferase